MKRIDLYAYTGDEASYTAICAISPPSRFLAIDKIKNIL
jgi:hypothetical protein